MEQTLNIETKTHRYENVVLVDITADTMTIHHPTDGLILIDSMEITAIEEGELL